MLMLEHAARDSLEQCRVVPWSARWSGGRLPARQGGTADGLSSDWRAFRRTLHAAAAYLPPHLSFSPGSPVFASHHSQIIRQPCVLRPDFTTGGRGVIGLYEALDTRISTSPISYRVSVNFVVATKLHLCKALNGFVSLRRASHGHCPHIPLLWPGRFSFCLKITSNIRFFVMQIRSCHHHAYLLHHFESTDLQKCWTYQHQPSVSERRRDVVQRRSCCGTWSRM